MKTSKNFWKNPWTVSIGSGLVVLIITVIVDMITAEKVFGTAKNIFLLMLEAFFAIINYELKVWWLLIVFGVLIFAFYIYIKYQGSKCSVSNQPQFLEYKKDTILGYLWKWRWEKNYLGKYEIEDLHPICTKCSTPLIHNCSGYGRLKCLRCDETYFKILPQEGDVKTLIYDNVRRKYFPNE